VSLSEFHFSHDARTEAVGRGPVWRSPVILNIVTACQPSQAFRYFRRQRSHAWPDIGNVVLVLFVDALAAAAGMLLMINVSVWLIIYIVT